ncbi:MAG TPA: UvrD-helicase domain-containing protein [Polyangiaceae bacterium]
MSATRVAHPKSGALVARPRVLRSVPLDRHAVIEASAGTGKTFTLEHLVVELVLAGDVPLDQVLVVTFTEKATNELRVRVRGKLEDLLAGCGRAPDDAEIAAGDFWTIDDAARAKIARALHAFDGATIATIHAFCQRVLRDNAFASGRLFEEQQVDGRDAFARAFREALRCDVARDPVRSAWLEAGLRAGRSVGGIEELLWDCIQAKAELRPEFDPRRLEEAIAAFPLEEARLTEGKTNLRAWGVPANTVTALGGRLWELALVVEEARDAGSPQQFVLEAEQRVDFAYLIEKLTPLGPRPGPTGRACAAALAIARATPSMQAALAATILPAVRAELARRKRLAGQYDFDDMLSLVDEALRGPRAGALVAAMRERWRYALIDEFQDTDETQWDIFRRAFFERQPRGEGAGASVLYLVGDPKQSIYRFRGADVQTYLRARDEIVAAGGALLRLGDNYRATPALVGATNALFAPPYFTGRVAYEPVSCGRPDRALVDGEGRPVTPLHVVRFERDVPVASYGTLVAREIRRITDPERPWRLDGEPLGHRDVFVLTRTKAEGRAVAACLRAAGVPHAFYKEEGLFQTDEAKEIRALLDAVDAPHDRARRLAAWMTPFFGLPLGDVERARDLPATHPYVARLGAWKALADARDFDRLFESLVRDSGVVRRELFFADGERDLTNYLHVFELLLEQTRRGHCTLRDLVHLLTGLIDMTRLTLDLEGNVQRLESDRRAVQITTIHKAKGLEAPVVFIAGGWTQGRADDVHVYHEDERRLGWVGKARADVKALVVQEEREEQQRLLYVALTRAMGRLVLPCLLRDGKPDRLRGPYEAVHRRVFELSNAGGDLVSVEDLPRLVAIAGGRTQAAAEAPWQPPVALLTEADGPGDHEALRESRAGAVVTSYTRMHASRSSARAEWTEANERRMEKAAEELDASRPVALRSARASGVFLHEVLERVPLASFAERDFAAWRARPEVGALVEDAMAVHRVPPEQREHAERLVWAALTTPVALPGGETLARIADADRVVREMEFVFSVTGAGAFVRGSLDLAFEHRGRTYFVDWKTDSLGSYARDALAAHVEAHYADQVQLYALATVKLLGIEKQAEHDARFGGLLYCFLRGMDGGDQGVWSARPTWAEVTAWDEALARRWRTP